MDNLIINVNQLLSPVMIVLLIGTGVYFTLRLGFIQLRHFGHMFFIFKYSRKSDDAGISPFQALCTSLAARVGTGNLAGVAIAISLGGPGAVLWMWITALLGMSTAFAESTLAQLFKVKDSDGNYRGGPAYYMEKGLGTRSMGIFFSICMLLAFGLIFNSIQANSITLAAELAFDTPKWLTGCILVLLAACVIFGGLQTIARFSELIVPLMALLYLGIAAFVVINNIHQLPSVFKLIIDSAFSLEKASAGFLGYATSQAMIQGIQRGLFSNEAGMGSAPNAAATASCYPNHPASQGYIQMMGVFVDTIVICTCTAGVVLMSGQLESGSGLTGIELTQKALSSQVGDWATIFIAIAIFFFAFTSIVANYSYAETNLVFLEKKHTTGLIILRLATLIMVMFGSVGKQPIIWSLTDIIMGLMATTNLIALLALSPTIIKVTRNYSSQLKQGKLPKFNSSEVCPKIQARLEPGIWDEC